MMNKALKISVIVACSLVSLAILFCVGTMAVNNYRSYAVIANIQATQDAGKAKRKAYIESLPLCPEERRKSYEEQTRKAEQLGRTVQEDHYATINGADCRLK